MARPPTQRHRVLAAIECGLIVRVEMSPNAALSWQWWTGEGWRKTTGAEYNALKAVLEADPTLIEPDHEIYGGKLMSYRLTEAGRLMRKHYTDWMGVRDFGDVPRPPWA